MLKFLYILIAILIVIQILQRRFDFLSVAAGTYLLYTINCAHGLTWITRGATRYYYYAEIGNKTYGCVFIQMMIILVFLFADKSNVVLVKRDRLKERNPIQREANHYPQFWRGIVLLSLLIFLYTIVFSIGISSFFSNTKKSELLSNVSFLFSLGIWGAILSFFHALKFEKKQAVIPALLVLVTLLLGSRAYFASILIGLIILYQKKIKSAIRQNLKISICSAVLILFLMVYKNIYKAIRALDFSLVISSLKSGGVTSSIFDIGEFRTVFSIYDYIVMQEFHLPLADSFIRVISIVPFVNDFVPTSYPIRMSSIAKTIFFQSTYGVASNFWGETFAMGGIILLSIVTVLWLAFLRGANRYLDSDSDSAAFVITAATYCAFYIHRLDWTQVMGCLKSMLVFYILWYVYRQFFVKRVCSETVYNAE